MHLHLFSTKELVAELAHGRVTAEPQALDVVEFDGHRLRQTVSFARLSAVSGCIPTI